MTSWIRFSAILMSLVLFAAIIGAFNRVGFDPQRGTISMEASLGAKALAAARGIATDQKWKLLTDAAKSGTLPAKLEAIDACGKHVVITGDRTDGRHATLSVRAEAGSQYTVHAITTELARRLGIAPKAKPLA